MEFAINVEGKIVGQTRSSHLQLTTPVRELTLRALIEQIVRAEVKAFQNRQEDRRLLHVMTKAEIDLAIPQGKFDMGARQDCRTVNEDQAVTNALEAFADGLYVTFIAGKQMESLEQTIQLKSETSETDVRFIRLIPLAGG